MTFLILKFSDYSTLVWRSFEISKFGGDLKYKNLEEFRNIKIWRNLEISKFGGVLKYQNLEEF